MATVIDIKNVKKSFGKKEVLRGASLKIERGTTQVILGGSGSGKSVLLKCILGLIEVDGGSISVNGKPANGLKETEHAELMTMFGMLFQNAALFDSMSVWENVAFVLLQRKMDRDEAKRIAIKKLAMVGLRADVAELSPAELSGGMRKRVGLARAICHEPEIIFYDEPTTGLDPITADVINDLIIKLQKELKCTSVVITHDMHSAFKVADRMAFLYQGQFIAEGDVKSFKNSDNPYVKQFVEGNANGPIQVTV
ncbi:MAG: ATP-binding cassette domain-containing protein [Proteobacteria bacterium]|nr:ATP-binding cassette domain-containing protein [Pseudomonadota bacterium]